MKQLRALLGEHTACRQIAAIRKLVTSLADAPTGANTAKWSDRYARLVATTDDLAYQCKQRDADEDIAGDTTGLHDWFCGCVLLLPPQSQ